MIVIIGSCSFLSSNFTLIKTTNGKATSNKTGGNSLNLKKSQFISNAKITSTNDLNSSLNFLFTNIGQYSVTDMVIDNSGNKYITGFTNANNLITRNAFNDTFSGINDVFVAKLSPENQIVFSTYFGGHGNDQANAIAIDKAGNCYVTGTTYSSDFPTKNENASTSTTQSINFPNSDIFVAKFNSSGQLEFSTFLGGSYDCTVEDISVDLEGNSYITGSTTSSDFPVKNGLNITYGGSTDAFVVKFNSTGQLTFSTYLGGSGDDTGAAISVDLGGNSYVTGSTTSSNFPIKNAFNGSYDGNKQVIFVSEFDTTGSLVFSTFLTSGTISDLAVDSSGNCYVTGTTYSKNFPTLKAFNNTYGGQGDAFVIEFNTLGSLVYGTYLGGNETDSGTSITFDSNGNYYILGETSSGNFPTTNSSYFSSKVFYSPFLAIFSPTNKLLSSFILPIQFDSFEFNSNILAIDPAGNFYVVGNAFYSEVFLKFDSLGKMISTIFLSGQFYTSGNSISVDKNGNQYLTGEIETYSLSKTIVSTSSNTFNTTFPNNYAVFVLKLNSKGNIVFSTYLGGYGDVVSSGIAVDSDGNVYITGSTTSSDFPVKNAYQSVYGGGYSDAFVTKLNSTGGLVFSTYLGGNAIDSGTSIAVDSAGNVYVTGSTSSSNFPMKNAFNSTFGGGYNDGFVAKLNSNGELVFSTYLGGNNNDYGSSIAVDNAGDCYVTGMTFSDDFPLKNAFNSAFDTTYGSIFVTKFNANGLLKFSTYLGGNGWDEGTGIATDANGNIYVTGFTQSSNFPVKNAFNKTYSGNEDVFLTKFNTNGQLLFSTYLGGSYSDFADALAVDTKGNSYITGYTMSNNFPGTKAFNDTSDSAYKLFITKISSTDHLVFSTLLESSNRTFNSAIAVDANGNSFVVGSTSSTTFNTKNTNYTISTGGTDAFIAVVNSSGSMVYCAYISDSFLLGMHETIPIQLPLMQTSSSQLTGSQSNYQLLVFVFSGGTLVVVGSLGVVTGVEYRKYAKTKKDIPSTSKYLFTTYLKGKFTKSRNNSSSKTKLSQEVFEKLEQIEKENAPKE